MAKMGKLDKPINETIEVEFYTDNGKQYVYIGSECGSGCRYQVKSFEDIGKVMAEYAYNYLPSMNNDEE